MHVSQQRMIARRNENEKYTISEENHGYLLICEHIDQAIILGFVSHTLLLKLFLLLPTFLIKYNIKYESVEFVI